MPSQISGARYAGVPTNVPATEAVCSMTLAMPKSPSFTSPFFMRKTFRVFRSRWIISLAWIYLKANAHWPRIVMANGSSKGLFSCRRVLTAWAKSPPSACSNTMCNTSVSTKESKYATMCGCDKRRSTATSAKAPRRPSGGKHVRSTFFSTRMVPMEATQRAAPLAEKRCRTKTAWPKAPRPKTRITSNCAMPPLVSPSFGSVECSNGLANNSPAEGRFSGSFCNISSTSALTSGAHSSGIMTAAATIFITNAARFDD
mmetsp:Transcript_44004/g.127048  ORF Transcript_44004/g.127048 Transcript_44004/m.127048 type:complete len:258 (-) Transcript_44004:768-1541(-)